MTHKARSVLAGAIFGIAFASQAHAIEFSYPQAVVELFTSQGCSSCPPADAALKEINEGDGILGLGLHVDYWDRLGWADTFASAENTERQWQYARALGERQVYTPQAIINGRMHMVGSKKRAILDQARAFSEGSEGLKTLIELSLNGDVIEVHIPADALEDHATLYAVYFNPAETVDVLRGENAGRKLEYTNIVGRTEMIAMVGAKGLDLDFSASEMRQRGFGGCALMLQANGSDGLPGPIIGASVISDF